VNPATVLEIPRNLYDFQPRYLELGGYRLHFLDEGRGDPLVMVHGNPSWSFMYRRLASSLRSRFRVIVPDHIGCGFSDKPDDSVYDYILESRIRDLETLLETLGVSDNITLALHDWGGLIGMGYATRHPDRIARIILLNTAAFHLPEGKRLHWSILYCRRSRLAGYMIRRLNLFARIASRIGCRQNPMSARVRKAYLAPYNNWENRRAILRFIQDIPLEPSDPSYEPVSEIEKQLNRLSDIPVLICWGERDFVFDLEFLKEWERRFPAAEVHRFPKAGHYVLEDAFDRIFPLIHRFLDDSRGN